MNMIFAKISRGGESFWVRDVKPVAPGFFAGVVDNELGIDHPLKYGDNIQFAASEVRELQGIGNIKEFSVGTQHAGKLNS